jgi:hypothetical protein
MKLCVLVFINMVYVCTNFNAKIKIHASLVKMSKFYCSK